MTIQECHHSRLRGFTMIELLLVVVLIAVIAGLVLPNLGTLFSSYEFHTSATTVEALIVSAYHETIASGVPFQLTIDTHERTLRLDQYVFDQRSAGAPELVPLRMVTLPETIATMTVDTPSILLFPDGSSTPARITMANKTNGSVSFTIGESYYDFKVQYAA